MKLVRVFMIHFLHLITSASRKGQDGLWEGGIDTGTWLAHYTMLHHQVQGWIGLLAHIGLQIVF